MVANKSKLVKHLDDERERGDSDISKISLNLDSSPASSSDNSLKCNKSDNEMVMDQPFDNNIKDESNDIDVPRNLNSTFLCLKSAALSDYIEDASIGKDKELNLSILQENDENKYSESGTWKYRNLFSLSSKHFDVTLSNSKLSDLSMALENTKSEEAKLVNEETDDSLIAKIRNCLAKYQELRGIPRDEYTFTNLIKVMGQVNNRCLLALFYIILNITPILEIFLHILRFIIDKIINIKNTSNTQEIIVKTAIFFMQLLSIYVFLFFIFGLIVSPILRMAFGILAKIMLCD